MAAAWVCDTGTSLPSVIESPLWSRCIDAQDVGWWMRAGWQKEASKPPLFAATAMVVASPGGYVAAGNVGLGPGASLWTSTDGIAWVPVAGVGLRSGASADQLVSDARPVLLVGRDANGGSLAPLSAGGSADQTAWCVLRPRLRSVAAGRAATGLWRPIRAQMLEATAGIEPAYAVLQTAPWTTRARRPDASHWLPREDSNLGSRIQSPLSYH